MSEFSQYGINEVLSGIVFNNIPLIIETGQVQNVSIESDLSVDATLTIKASSVIDIETDLSVNAFAIKSVSASLSSILDISVTSPAIIGEIEIDNIAVTSSLQIADLIRFTPDTRYPGSYIPLLLLDGAALSSQNRNFSESLKTIFVENKNWNNDKNRYYKRSNAGKKIFSLSWEWLPSDRENTIDKREARNFIKDKAIDPDVHTLTVASYGENPEDIFEETNYNVFITNYTEELIRRDLNAGVYFWKCELEMEEL